MFVICITPEYIICIRHVLCGLLENDNLKLCHFTVVVMFCALSYGDITSNIGTCDAVLSGAVP